MMNSPCAMLMTPICPNVRASPRAISSRMEPWETPAKSCPTRTSMWCSPVVSCPCRRPGEPTLDRHTDAALRWTGSAQVLGPVVGLQERVRLDRAVGGPDGLDQAVGLDLA